jgi:hypothetical protein
MPAIEYIHGHGYVSPKHQWDFEVRGLESFAINKVAPSAYYDDYRYWIADNVPEETLFTLAEYDGNSRHQNMCSFFICAAVSDQKNLIKTRYGNNMIDGNYRIVAHGDIHIRAQLLYEWWYRYSPYRTVDYAEHCALYMEKRWTKKKLPPMDDEQIVKKRKVTRVCSIDSMLDNLIAVAADNRKLSSDKIVEEALRLYFKHLVP